MLSQTARDNRAFIRGLPDAKQRVVARWYGDTSFDGWGMIPPLHVALASGRGDYETPSHESREDSPAIENDPGYTFTRQEVDLLNSGWYVGESDARRAELEALMPTYRPQPHPLRGIRPGV